MRLIELHILQSFPVSCLNRDDVGAPKSAVFGGATRARISSQCLKRAIRETARSMQGSTFMGSRTRKAATELAAALTGQFGWDVDAARKTAEEVLHLFLAKELPKAKPAKKPVEPDASPEQEQTSTLLYFSPAEIGTIAGLINGARENKPQADAKALKEAVVKGLRKGLPKDAVDIAVFGRMVANAADVTLEGAGMFSHALSTHKCDNDMDFWTAVEDEKQAGDDAGAANMGTAEFNSACYYRYAALNLDLLFDVDHLRILEPEERRKVVETFIRATLLAVPGARRNSMNACTLPAYVLGVVKDKGQPIQLVNAFEKPVWSKDGLATKSVEALRAHHEQLKQTWGIELARTADGKPAEFAIPDVTLDAFCKGLIAHVH
jgi:CRISPR system Cascade subunit CasC